MKLLGPTVEVLKASIAPAMPAMPPLAAMAQTRALLRDMPKDSAACTDVRINSRPMP